MLAAVHTAVGFHGGRSINDRFEPDLTTGVPVCAAVASIDGSNEVFQPGDGRFAARLADPRCSLITHDAASLRQYCRLTGCRPPVAYIDTRLAAVLLAHAERFAPAGGAYAQADLPAVASRFKVSAAGLGELGVLAGSVQCLRHAEECGRRAAEAYCLASARACLGLHRPLMEAVSRQCGHAALHNLVALYQPFAVAASDSVMRGIVFDQDGWERFSSVGRRYRRRLLAAARSFGYEYGRPSTFASAISKVGLLVSWPRGEDGMPCLTDDVLKARRHLHPVVALAYRLLRLDRSLGLRLGERADRDGRIRCAVQPLAQRSSRTTTARPNLPGLPGSLRPLLLPGTGRVWLLADFVQFEPGVAAALSRDPNLLADFRAGDVYEQFGRQTGLITRGMSPAEAKVIRDRRLKQLFLAVLYGQSDVGLAASLGCPLPEAQAMLTQFAARYRRLTDWLHDQVTTSLGRGWAESVTGFRAAFTTSCPRDRGHVERSCQNFIIQASAAACFQATGVHLAAAGLDIRLGLHDGYLVNVPDDPVEIAHAQVAVRAAAGDAVAELFPGLPCNLQIEVLRRFAKGGNADSLDTMIQSLETEELQCPAT